MALEHPMTSSVPVAVAPNGGRRTKADHPALPIGPAELARTAVQCLEAGAAMIHVHVRDGEDRHLLDADAYATVIAAIKAEVGERLVIQITSEALGIYSPQEQMAVIRAVKPQAASLALREIVPGTVDEKAFGDFLHWMKAERIAPQFIVYTPEEAVHLDALRKRGVVPFEEPPVLYVLGRYSAGQTSVPQDLVPFLVPGQPVFQRFMVCAFGIHEAACTIAGGLLGGGLRVGFENNLVLPDGTLAASNAELVTTARRGLEAAGMHAMSGEELAQDWSEL